MPPGNFPNFGKSFAVSGNWLAIADPGSNDYVHLFQLVANQWVLETSLSSQADFPTTSFGLSVSLKIDYLMIGKSTTVNGTQNVGVVEIHHYNNGWNYNRTVMADTPQALDYFGHNRNINQNDAMATDGVNFIIGAPGKNANGYNESGMVAFGSID